MKALVVSYSWSGMTRTVAADVARLGEWEREELVELRGRHGLRGFVRALVEARLERPSRLRRTVEDPAAYDLVVVGTPIWGGRASTPVATYLREHAAAMPEVAFFFTYGHSGPGRALAQMEALARRAPQSWMGVSARQVASGEHRLAVRGFVDELRERMGAVPPPLRVHPELAAERH